MIGRLAAALTALATAWAVAAAAADTAGGVAAARDALGAGDFAQAFDMLEPLAEAGDAEAQTMLGDIHRSGMLGLLDTDAAAGWYERAAAQGHPEAQFRLGLMFYQRESAPAEGAATLDDLYAAAAGSFRAAAAQGHAKAQLYLGHMVADGIGVDPDAGEAYMWYQLAAWQRNGLAASALDKLASSMSAVELTDARTRAGRFTARPPDAKLDWAQ